MKLFVELGAFRWSGRWLDCLVSRSSPPRPKLAWNIFGSHGHHGYLPDRCTVHKMNHFAQP